jgi:phosphoribosylanthranilate isomerase
MKGIIQVAGIVDQEEAQALVELGVHYLGFPLRLAVHKEDISEEEAARIIRSLRPPTTAILITYLDKALDVIEFCRRLGVAGVQLHSDISITEVRSLRALAPKAFIIKSLVVKDDNLHELETCIAQFHPYVDAFITDTYDPSTSACGATGKTHDWNISRRMVEVSPRPVILAGGLNPGNVREAIFYVRPAGVDVHTGVEGPSGRKDRELVSAFVSEATKALELVGK